MGKLESLGLMVLLAAGSAWAGIEGKELVLAVERADAASLAQAKAVGADGALVWAADAWPADNRGLELWVGFRPRFKLPLDVPAQAAGVALVFPTPKAGEPTKPSDFAKLLALKRQGDALADSIRQIKKSLAPGQRLAICVPMSEIDPETALAAYVPVRDLVRDGTADVVCLSGAGRCNYHRLRLLRDAPLRTAALFDAAAGKSRGGELTRVALDTAQNDSCDGLWVIGMGPALAGRTVRDAIEGKKRSDAQRAALDKAIADGLIAVDQGVPEKARNNHATVHGVAQSFVPSRDGLCPLVELYCALRRCPGALPPAMKVEIRADDAGRPAKTSLAQSTLDPAELGHEPAYRWGCVRFDPPVALKKGVTYWIYAPPSNFPEGTYMWGMKSNGATERGHAWSSQYKYEKHTWVFRVYLKKEAAQ